MDKSLPLSEKEIIYKINTFNPFVRSLIERCRTQFGIPASHFRVLDFGCGRGKNVGALLRMGYDAFGVDIDPVVLRSAQSGLLLSRQRVLQISERNAIPFKDETFHFIITEHVLEHVRYLSPLIEEFNRILRPEGYVYNVYPPIGRFIEPHLEMPIVHYFEDGTIRRLLVGFFIKIGLHPRWRKLDFGQLVSLYTDYLNTKVHHRSNTQIKQLFGAFFDCTVVTDQNEKVLSEMRRLVPFFGLSSFLCKHVIPATFITHLLCVKRRCESYGRHAF